jgi:hypothetical protein
MRTHTAAHGVEDRFEVARPAVREGMEHQAVVVRLVEDRFEVARPAVREGMEHQAVVIRLVEDRFAVDRRGRRVVQNRRAGRGSRFSRIIADVDRRRRIATPKNEPASRSTGP